MKTTDLESIKDVAISFLYIEVSETDFSPIVVSHPVFESGILYTPHTQKMVNILEDKDGFQEILDHYEKRIRNENSLVGIYMIIRGTYRLAFFKYIKDYLSTKDYAKYLADAWITSENPNQDVNVSLDEAARLFQKANKKFLMDKKEYEVYSSLPETFTVYRGVARGRNPKGMSWTQNKDTAEWFSNRFNIGDEVGYVQAATAHKKDVLAYFNGRNEDELVISTKSLKDIHRIE